MNMDMEEYEYDEGDEEISQEDGWAVISAFFEEKGLVRQQLDSFNEFIQNTMQEIVDESADIEIRPESQHNLGHQPDFLEVIFTLLPCFCQNPNFIFCLGFWLCFSMIELFLLISDLAIESYMLWIKPNFSLWIWFCCSIIEQLFLLISVVGLIIAA